MKKYEHLEEQILSLYNQKMSSKEIYELLNIPKSSYLYIRRKLNLPARPKSASNISIDSIMMYIVGTVMGDSHLSKRGKEHSSISFAHAKRYKDYFDYKINLLSSLEGSIHEHIYYDKRTEKYYPRYCYCSRGIINLKEIRNLFYPNGKKSIPMDLIRKYFSEESLAILFMDDGSSQKYNTIISTQCFEKNNLKEFIEFLKEKFDIEFTIQEKGPIRLKQKDSKKFYNIVKKEINKVPSMQYKLKFMSS